MKIPRFGPLSFIFLITNILSLCNSNICHDSDRGHAPLFIFGDSLFDVGNNNHINTWAQANFKPYGETVFKYPSGRFSDGRLIPDFIAEYLDIPLSPPYLQSSNQQFIFGANFASAAAGALFETLRESANPIPVPTQLSYFNDVVKQLSKELGYVEAKELLSRSIFLISLGGNDYIYALFNVTVLQTYSVDEYVGMVVGNISSAIQEMYGAGARKFGFINMSPLGCIPLVKAAMNSNSCLEEANALAKLHNKILAKALYELKRKLIGFEYSIFDAYSSIEDRLNNPSKYGLKEVATACCGSGKFRGNFSCGGRAGAQYEVCKNPNKYLFFDASHFTDKTYKQLAQQFWAGGPNIVSPYNLKTLSSLK